MLYETAARSSEVLALDIEDLDRRNRRAKVTPRSRRSRNRLAQSRPATSLFHTSP